MKRRTFLGNSLAVSLAGLYGASCNTEQMPWDRSPVVESEAVNSIAGLPIKNLREDYRHRLLDLYITQWENGGFDSEQGGFTTMLDENGAPTADEKRLIDQGDALWVYSYMYTNMGEDEEFLGIATKTRNFLVEQMYVGKGEWYESVSRQGELIKDISANVLGWLHAANGLTEYYRATKNDEDRDIVFETVWAALREYDAIGYDGISNNGGIPMDIPLRALRKLDHSAQVIRLLSNFLTDMKSRRFEEELARHLSYVSENFFNPKLGILNVYLNHNYTRIDGYEDYMQTARAIETMTDIMFAARDTENLALFEDAVTSIRRYVEIAWDYTFEGLADGHSYVFDGPGRNRMKLYDRKTLSVHCTAMTALFHIYEFTGEQWAVDWYGRIRAYSTSKFDSGTGVWPLTLDRFGLPVVNEGPENKRRDVFYQARWLMMNLISIDRMLEQMGVSDELV